MKRFLCGILSVILLVLSLSSCSSGGQSISGSGDALQTTECDHDWAETTCDTPRTCTKCGKTEGDALGHNMINGTCTFCGYSEWSVEDFGFYDLDKCNKFLQITSYNQSANKVGYYFHNFYKITEFGDEYFQTTEKYTTGRKDSISKHLYEISDSKTIIVENRYNERIIEIDVIDKENNYFVMKTLDSMSDEHWYLTYDAVDWTKEPYVEENKNNRKCLYFTLKS